jgi:hypothetical protein
MRQLFPGYYPPSGEDYKRMWDEGIFILDTNVLLHIYEYSDELLERLFEVVERLEDRIWIPHQVAMEFHRRRIEVIGKRHAEYRKVRDALRKAKSALDGPHQYLHFDASTLSPLVEEALRGFEELRATLVPEVGVTDIAKDRLTALLDGKVGTAYAREEQSKKHEQAKTRYKEEIPPGYKDASNTANPQGDAILWFQMLDHARDKQKPIVFVTDDEKADWWLKYDNDRLLGPRPELVAEMAEQGVTFHMYTATKFLNYAVQQLRLQPLEQELLEEATDVQQHDIGGDDVSRHYFPLLGSRTGLLSLSESDMLHEAERTLMIGQVDRAAAAIGEVVDLAFQRLASGLIEAGHAFQLPALGVPDYHRLHAYIEELFRFAVIDAAEYERMKTWPQIISVARHMLLQTHYRITPYGSDEVWQMYRDVVRFLDRF